MSDQDQPLFFDRELSWLEFNARVLHEAIDDRTPLLERARFLGIFNSNLDEFFMKRVGGLKRQLLANVSTPLRQLAEIRKSLEPTLALRWDTFSKTIQPALAKEGIELLGWSDLSPAEQDFARAFFEKNIFPVLTPLAVDPGHPFPFISNLSTSLGVLLKHTDDRDEVLFSRIKIPDVFPAWIRLDPKNSSDAKARFVSIVEIIVQHLPTLFPGMTIEAVMAFRITRNADLERDEEDADDLLEMISQELRERRFADVVRLEHGPNPHPTILKLLMEELEFQDSDIYECPVPMEYNDLSPLLDLKRPELKFPAHVPAWPIALGDEDADIFGLIRQGDVLVHHPYESFTSSVERFINSAAEDPKVLAIKMTLYRTGKDSPFIPLLIRAAESGKQVVCLVELKARFDEEKNIRVAQALEKAGVHVVYGVVGLKTHCKIALVVRQEAEGVRSYAHLGTGNYHTQTARLYTDLGLFSANSEFTDDVAHLFHYLTGLSFYHGYKKLLVAPLSMKDGFLKRIDREIENKNKGLPSGIIAKMNSLEDEDICKALYKASSEGVSIDLIIRGFCSLRPQVPGLSENIRVTSVIGRFLEHSRIFHFRNGKENPIDGEFFIGSADWMYRNLMNRVEAIAPIGDPSLKAKCYEILDLVLRDRRQTWELQANGAYIQRVPTQSSEEIGVQARLIQLARLRNMPTGYSN
jgi:polyphosphate kinase